MDCPICQSTAYLPRLYECGHTCCHLCMLKSDAAALEETPSNTLPLYRCPVCRTATLLQAEDRPINQALAQLLESTMPDFAEQQKAAVRERDEWVTQYGGCTDSDSVFGSGYELGPSERMWLPEITQRIRNRKSHTLYQRVVRLMMDAASRGQKVLTITTRVRELSDFAEELARMLFRHGIYGLHVTPRSFTIYILKAEQAHPWGEDWLNPDYEAPHSLQPPEDFDTHEASV